MEDFITIPKKPQLSVAEDYDLLRTTGRQYIENLASDLWTDYNLHDPGITILEALCYAITELGYRTKIPINDLLTGADGKLAAAQPFFTARDILTCSPLTINDYRKLLADIVGVHNAWLYADDYTVQVSGAKTPVNEVPIFADCQADSLTVNKTEHPLYLSGLYRVLLDLENDDAYGDLNKGDIEIFNPQSSGPVSKFKAGEISFNMELPRAANANLEWVTAAADTTHINTINIELQDGSWVATVSTDTGLPDLSFVVTINLKPAGKLIEKADMQDFFSVNFVSQIFYLYLKKIEKITSIQLQAKKTLHANRNFCEDFIQIDTVKDEDVAVCCDIDVRPDTDMELVQAQVFYAIENYLNPAINFYLLKELIAKGVLVDDIFQGPKLNHGFIDTSELEGTQLRNVIYSSDIINLLMDIDGVLAVKNFILTKYDENGVAVPTQVALKWCMHISPKHKPVLSINRSKIVFFKNNFPFLASYSEIKDSLQLMRAARERPKLKGQQHDLQIPGGTYKDVADYWPVQNDLPQTYGVGEVGLPISATPLRSAQARQLKAYLMFYDQILADFFSQLSNAKSLFGLQDIKQSYFSQFLKDVPDILPVYKQFPPGNPLIGDVFLNQDLTFASANPAWKDLVETSQTFEERRNVFLDHLLGRFAESFSDYVLMLYNVDFSNSSAKALGAEKLISNKIEFLKEYPAISYARGTGFNYFPLAANHSIDQSRLWDTGNVSGLEKRASKLAGIKNYSRRFLSCIKNIEIKVVRKVEVESDVEIIKTYHEFVISTAQGDQIIQNGKIQLQSEAEAVVNELMDLLGDKANYLYDSGSKKIEVIGAGNKVLAISTTRYKTKFEADKVIKSFENEFQQECPDAEGMLLIEHILLRPQTKTYSLFQVCLNPGCDFCGEEDPYSFRASVYLPSWTEQFSNMNFRAYFENMIRAEAPAHAMLKVCWLGYNQMRQLELAYKRWVFALAAHNILPATTAKANELRVANNQLVQLMATLNSVYPQATLHDCDESVNTNPVKLGKTKLGTFKPKNNE